MKRQILDAPFENDIHFYLEQYEKLLWNGESQKLVTPKRLISFDDFKRLGSVLPTLLSFTLIFFLVYLLSEKSKQFFIFIGGTLSLLGLLFIFPSIFKRITNRQRKKTNYFITQYRIIIQTSDWGNKQMYFIPRSDVSNLKLSKAKNWGSISFHVKNQPTSDLFTRKFIDGKTVILGNINFIKHADYVFEILKKPDAE